MALKIRLRRMGHRNNPFYRMIVVDSRWRRDGKAIAELGWYDPVKEPAQIAFDEKAIYQWLEKGVKPSDTIRALFKRYGIIDRFRSGEYKNLDESQLAKTSEVQQLGKARAIKPIQPTPEAPAPETPAESAPAEAASEGASETEAATAEPSAEPAEENKPES